MDSKSLYLSILIFMFSGMFTMLYWAYYEVSDYYLIIGICLVGVGCILLGLLVYLALTIEENVTQQSLNKGVEK